MLDKFEGDMIYKIIRDHLNRKGNLDPVSIQDQVQSEGITLDLKLVQGRIDEFKKTQAYRDYNS
jgi:hypothetical protein